MKIRKILYPTDFSSNSSAALECAASLAKVTESTLLIIHAQEPSLTYGDGLLLGGRAEPDPEIMRNMLSAVNPQDATIHCRHRFVQGLPASAILSVAQEEEVALIVMGSHGRTGLGRLLMGSVAEEVMRKAKCPVMVVKPTSNASNVNQT